MHKQIHEKRVQNEPNEYRNDGTVIQTAYFIVILCLFMIWCLFINVIAIYQRMIHMADITNFVYMDAHQVFDKMCE